MHLRRKVCRLGKRAKFFCSDKMKHQSCREQSFQFTVFHATCISMPTFMPLSLHFTVGQEFCMYITASKSGTFAQLISYLLETTCVACIVCMTSS